MHLINIKANYIQLSPCSQAALYCTKTTNTGKSACSDTWPFLSASLSLQRENGIWVKENFVVKKKNPFLSYHVGVCISVCTLHTFSNWHKSIRGQKKKWPLYSKIMMWSRSEDVLCSSNAPLHADVSFSQLLEPSYLAERGSTFMAYIVIINSVIIQALSIYKSLG